MSRGLTLEQMEFLASKGVTAAEMVAFAKMAGGRSKGAERTARWRAKKSDGVTESVTSDVTSDASRPPIDNTHTPCSSDEEQTPKPKSDKPEGVDAEVWTDFKALRQKLRAPITKTAMAGLAREAEKAGMSLNAALAECVERSWRGFKAEWMESSRRPGERPGSKPPPSMMDHLRRERELSRGAAA